MFYTYYVKAEDKYYFGSRTNKVNLKRDAKDDFMIHYFTSTKDKRLREIIQNGEYEKAEIIKEYTDKQECLKDEERLIKLFWAFYGTGNSWNHHADGKFSTAGIPRSNEAIEKYKCTRNNKSDEEKAAEFKNRSEANKGEKNPNYGKKMSHTAKVKQRFTMLNKSEEEINRIVEKQKETWRNKSEEEINRIVEKRKNSLSNKSDEEKAAEFKNRSEAAKKFQASISAEKRLEINKKCSEANKGRKMTKFQWQTPTGEIKTMNMCNALRHHPDWVFIGPVES